MAAEVQDVAAVRGPAFDGDAVVAGGVPKDASCVRAVCAEVPTVAVARAFVGIDDLERPPRGVDLTLIRQEQLYPLAHGVARPNTRAIVVNVLAVFMLLSFPMYSVCAITCRVLPLAVRLQRLTTCTPRCGRERLWNDPGRSVARRS